MDEAKSHAVFGIGPLCQELRLFFFFLNWVSCLPVRSPFSGSSPVCHATSPHQVQTQPQRRAGLKELSLYHRFPIMTRETSGKCDKWVCISREYNDRLQCIFFCFFPFPVELNRKIHFPAEEPHYKIRFILEYSFLHSHKVVPKRWHKVLLLIMTLDYLSSNPSSVALE